MALSRLATEMPEEQEKAVQMALALVMVSMYMVEFRVHVVRGDDPYDAMLKAVRGELPIPEQFMEKLEELRKGNK